MISVSRLSKIYRIGQLETKALNNISFQIKKGEFIAIIGPSGSGKSTLMHILGALDIPTSGRYYLDGHDLANLTEDQLADIRNHQIGFVFQSYNLLPRISALKNVALPMAYAGIPKEQREKKARDLLKSVGLGDRFNHAGNQLSGGQQQRVAIARALSMNPAILLADEPTGNIATTQAKEVMKIFRRLNKNGHTIIMITHEADIAAYANRIIALRDGRIISDSLNRGNH